MYIPPAYEITDWEEITSFVSQARAGEFVTVNQDGTPASTTLPFTWYPSQPDLAAPVKSYGVATTHMARSNQQWREIENGAPALIIVSGPGAYVSPTNYAAASVEGKDVGTWVYQSVHLRGTVQVLHEALEILKIVSDLQRDHEADREVPWDLATADQNFINELVRHVVGFTVHISSVEAKYKMEQKKVLTDRERIVEDLLKRGGPDDLAVASEMKRLYQI
jgi:transcriptional regulator